MFKTNPLEYWIKSDKPIEKTKVKDINKVTSNYDLWELGNGMIDLLDKNTYMKLAIQKKEPENAIVNLSDKSGTHWVAFNTDNDNNINYYDSFGIFPPINIKGRVIKYNTKQDQKMSENNCGTRALNYLFGIL